MYDIFLRKMKQDLINEKYYMYRGESDMTMYSGESDIKNILCSRMGEKLGRNENMMYD